MIVQHHRVLAHTQRGMWIPTYWIASAVGYIDGLGENPSAADMDFQSNNALAG